MAAAAALLSSQRGRPSQACCRRALSTVYYAAFHYLARQCSDLLIGSSRADRSIEAWQQVYRSLDHGTVKHALVNQTILRKFPKPIEDFASLFVALQEKRHRADYDPLVRVGKSEVLGEIKQLERALSEFGTVSAKHRRAFCAYVLFRRRT